MKNRVKALLTVLGLSVIMINTNEITAYADGRTECVDKLTAYADEEREYPHEQTRIIIDLDGGQSQSECDLNLIHKEINRVDDDGGCSTELLDYFSVEQVRELGTPTKTDYTFIGWHISSEIYGNDNYIDVTPLEIHYTGYYDNWDADDIAYSPRLVDENNNIIDEITLTAVYVPDLVIDAGDYVLGVEACRDMSDTSRYVYHVEKKDLPKKDDMTGFLETISDDTERNGRQIELDNYIDILPGETVKLVYKPSVSEAVINNNLTEEVANTDDILSEPMEENVDATAIGKFTEVQKIIVIAVVVFLGLLLLTLLIAYMICRVLTKVEVQNNKNTDDYMDNNFETVQKGNIEVEGNIGIYLTKLIDKNNTEVWKYTISDEIINNRVTDEFKIVLTKNFVKRFNGQQLIVKIGDGENAKTQGFTIDEQETEIKLVMEITD